MVVKMDITSAAREGFRIIEEDAFILERAEIFSDARLRHLKTKLFSSILDTSGLADRWSISFAFVHASKYYCGKPYAKQ